MADFSIGVDLGGTNLRISAVSSEGQLLEKVTLGTKVALGRDHVINEMCDAIQRLSAKYKEAGKLLGAGIGIPGIIDMQTGMLRKSANLPGWSDYPVRAEIERRLGARVVLGGKIWHGMNGMAGEFGHVTLEPEGHPCGCGNRGCAEQYASASAIVRMAREAIASGEAPSLAKAASSDAEFGAKSIYNLAIQGDEHARRIFRTFGRYLGILLAGLINVLNLDMFVIGGGVSSAWDAYAPNMFEELRERSLVYAATAPADPLMTDSFGKEEGASAQTESRTKRKTIITRALLGSDAGLYGAARVAVLAA